MHAVPASLSAGTHTSSTVSCSDWSHIYPQGTLSAPAQGAVGVSLLVTGIVFYVLVRGLFVRLPYERREAVQKKQS